MTLVYLARIKCDRCGCQTPVYGSVDAALRGAAEAWKWVKSMGADLCRDCAVEVHGDREMEGKGCLGPYSWRASGSTGGGEVMREFWIGVGPFDVQESIALPDGFDPVQSTSPFAVPAPIATVWTSDGYRCVIVCCGPPAPYPAVAGADA